MLHQLSLQQIDTGSMQCLSKCHDKKSNQDISRGCCLEENTFQGQSTQHQQHLPPMPQRVYREYQNRACLLQKGQSLAPQLGSCRGLYNVDSRIGKCHLTLYSMLTSMKQGMIYKLCACV